jgi:hypothetical protein
VKVAIRSRSRVPGSPKPYPGQPPTPPPRRTSKSANRLHAATRLSTIIPTTRGAAPTLFPRFVISPCNSRRRRRCILVPAAAAAAAAAAVVVVVVASSSGQRSPWTAGVRIRVKSYLPDPLPPYQPPHRRPKDENGARAPRPRLSPKLDDRGGTHFPTSSAFPGPSSPLHKRRAKS